VGESAGERGGGSNDRIRGKEEEESMRGAATNLGKASGTSKEGLGEGARDSIPHARGVNPSLKRVS